MDSSTTALQFIDFLRRKLEYESLINEGDRAYTQESATTCFDGATVYFSSAAYLIDSSSGRFFVKWARSHRASQMERIDVVDSFLKWARSQSMDSIDFEFF